MAINEWSTTAGNNATGVTGVTWAEGQAPSTVNDSARAVMADVATWYGQASGKIPEYLTSVAGTNTITATGPSAMSAYAAGQRFVFIPANTITGAATINITPSGASALGAKNLFAGGSAAVAGDLIANVPAIVVYDGTQFNIVTPTGRGGSSLVLLQTQTASNVATVDFTSGISSTYDHYILDCTKVVPGTDNTAFWVRVSVDGGSNYLSTNEYSYSRVSLDTVPAATAEGAGAQAQFQVKGGLGTGTGEQLNCQIHFQNLSDTARYKGATVNGVIYDATPVHISFHGGCSIFTTSAINAIRVMQGSGNINGTFSLYGVKKA